MSLNYLIRSAPHRYKVFKIPKKSSKDMRIIAQPAKEIKILQYWVMNNIFPFFPIHQNAIAYSKGKNIRCNCKPHINNPYLLKIDFKNFFPSIKGYDFIHYIKLIKRLHLSEDDIQHLLRILFWKPKSTNEFQLSIGAPSSPYLSNAIMYKFDNEISVFCSSQGIAYTRYADDLTFSMKDKTNRAIVKEKVLQILRDMPFPKLELNEKKTIYGSKANRRLITGLIITNNGEVSLGRNRKRLIRASIYNYINSKMSEIEEKRYFGMLSFAHDIEPLFIERMKKKFGKEAIRGK